MRPDPGSPLYAQWCEYRDDIARMRRIACWEYNRETHSAEQVADHLLNRYILAHLPDPEELPK